MPAEYLMESPREAARLEAKIRPESIRGQLEMLGLARGATVLDAGSGSGAAARVMSSMVGPEGRVIGLDLSPDRVAYAQRMALQEGCANATFLQGDLYSAPLPAASFDFIWSRFVFEYLADPDAALAALIRVLKPGAKVVVAELDGNGMFHYPIPDDLMADTQRLVDGIAGRFDPYAGRKLYYRFRKQGLDEVKVHVLPYHLYAGAASDADMENWTQKFAVLRQVGIAALGGEERYDRFIRRYLDLLRDPDALTYSILFLTEGIKR